VGLDADGVGEEHPFSRPDGLGYVGEVSVVVVQRPAPGAPEPIRDVNHQIRLPAVEESEPLSLLDPAEGVEEYARVTKPGGYVGLNEATWLKVPPPPEIVAWASQDLGACVKPLTSDDWAGLLEDAGLTEIVVNVREVRARREAKELARRYGYGGMLRSIYRALSLYARNPAYRRFVKEVRKEGITPDNLEEYLGYGVFIGRK